MYGVFAEPAAGAVSVLLTAHYDGVGDDPDARLPAACDNTSGVAVVLEAARLLTPMLPLGAGLAVALLDGEEIGARGSAHHAHQVSPGTFVVNIDGAAHFGEAAAVEAGGPTSCSLRSTRPGVPRAYHCGPGRCRRTTAATLPPECRRSGSAWACPATRHRPKPPTAQRHPGRGHLAGRRHHPEPCLHH